MDGYDEQPAGLCIFLCGAAECLSIQKERPWQAALNYGSLLVLFLWRQNV